MREDAQAKKGETKKTPARIFQLNGAAFGRGAFTAMRKRR
jgi:hypothetical protein